MNYLRMLATFVLAASATFALTPHAADASTSTGQAVTFENGAKIKVDGSTMTTTTPDGKSTIGHPSHEHFMKEGAGGIGGPVAVPMASCKYMLHWLDTHAVSNNWRANAETAFGAGCFG